MKAIIPNFVVVQECFYENGGISFMQTLGVFEDYRTALGCAVQHVQERIDEISDFELPREMEGDAGWVIHYKHDTCNECMCILDNRNNLRREAPDEE